LVALLVLLVDHLVDLGVVPLVDHLVDLVLVQGLCQVELVQGLWLVVLGQVPLPLVLVLPLPLLALVLQL
jgi:hypothetical protein